MRIDLANLTSEEIRQLKNPTRRDKDWAKIAVGIHPFGPAVRQPVGEKRCGDCKWAYPVDDFNKRFWKCHKRGYSRGEATDLRVSWPACEMFEDAPKESKP